MFSRQTLCRLRCESKATPCSFSTSKWFKIISHNPLTGSLTLNTTKNTYLWWFLCSQCCRCRLCLHLHPLERPVGGLLQPKAGWGTGHGTAAEGRSKADRQQSSTEPGGSETQTGGYIRVKRLEIRSKTGPTTWRRPRSSTHIVLNGLWMVDTLHSLTAHDSLLLVAESLRDMQISCHKHSCFHLPHNSTAYTLPTSHVPHSTHFQVFIF